MAHIFLSETDEWQLVHDDQDLRGRDLLDAGGLLLGQIDDMVINTDTEHIDEVVLTDGTRYPAADLDIEDEAVYVRGAGTTGRTPYAYEGLRRSEPVSGADTGYSEHVISGTDPISAATASTISGAESRDYLRDAPLGYDEDEADYESHYATTYAESGNPFGYYRQAYRFGNERGLDRPFDEAESGLRERWMSEFPDRHYDDYRDAVRYGYERRRG